MQPSFRILVLDDDKLVTSSLKSLLSLEGLSGAVFFNAPLEALEYLKKNPCEVIISDFIMDKMNGLEFLSEAQKLYPDSSRILLTGYADKNSAVKAINETGLYKYIEKPWDNDELIISIKNAGEKALLSQQLKETNKKLKEYNTQLEELVKEKTADVLETNEKLSAVINCCADSIVLISDKGVIQEANPAAEKLFGMTGGILTAKNISALLEFKENSLNKILSGRKSGLFRDVYAVNAASGSKTPVEISFAYIPENKYVFVIRDMSFQKETERLREDFIAALTHDLRTPSLAAIQTLEYFLNGTLGSLNTKQRMLLDTMKKSHEDMLGLVNTLLEVYKYEAGAPKLVKTPFDFERLVNECINQAEPVIQAKKQHIEKIFSNLKDREVIADRNEIRRVIVNLLGNAVKYTQEEGCIEVKAEIDGEDLHFSVKDNGCGISKKDIPLLFKRFSQGTRVKHSISTGLGLYLSKQIIDAHGGKIWMESDEGEGSEFFFVLINAAPVKDRDKVWTI